TAIGNASLTRVMGYTHKLGIDVKIATATGATDPSPTTIYAPTFDAGSPPVVYKTPAVVLPSTGGITLTCAWNNSNGNSTVRYGTSPITDERCGGVLSYYPAAGAHHCQHTTQAGGSITLCCPGAAGCP